MSNLAYTVDGRTFTILFPDLWHPLTAEQFETLKADIQETGIDTPIMVDEADGVIDGHNRLRAACELGFSLAASDINIKCGLSYGQKLAKAYKANSMRRQTNDGELAAAAARAREEFYRETGEQMSDRKLARMLGVRHEVIHRLGKQSSPKGSRPVAGATGLLSQPQEIRVGIDGRRYPATRSSPEQVQVRREQVVAMLAAGKKRCEIAGELGVTKFVIDKDVKAVARKREESSVEPVLDPDTESDCTPQLGVLIAEECPQEDPWQDFPAESIPRRQHEQAAQEMFLAGKSVVEIAQRLQRPVEAVSPYLHPSKIGGRQRAPIGPKIPSPSHRHWLADVLDNLGTAYECSDWELVRWAIDTIRDNMGGMAIEDHGTERQPNATAA